tara:strand:- start:409 stop:1785 length:1377 start_codon:yes stop_codon:yes gene_type:complete
MPDSLALSILLLAFFASITFNGFFRNIAKKYNILIDIPDKSRKFHFRPTPLTGGIGIFFSIILCGAILVAFTNTNYSVDFSNKGFLKSTDFNKGTVSKNFEVNNQDYELSLDRSIDDNEISVKIESDKKSNTVEIIALSNNRFKVVLPNNDEKIYLMDSGNVFELSNSDEKIDKFSPINTDKINIDYFSFSLFVCCFLIMIFMIFDDFFNIRPFYRLIFQFLITIVMILMSGEYLSNIGNLFGYGPIDLQVIAIPFTIFCVVGLMNAFNMIDGLNGICASLALIPIIYLTFIGNFDYGLLIPAGAIMGFLAYNLGYLGKKRRVFLGDSGSNMLGFAVAFICIEYSQNLNQQSNINPVTALWLVAIPLVDCIAVMMSRIFKGIMPFRPGRDHLHHKLLDLKIKPKKILYIIILLSIILALIGFTIELVFPNSEYVSFWVFFVLSCIYYLKTKVNFLSNV